MYYSPEEESALMEANEEHGECPEGHPEHGVLIDELGECPFCGCGDERDA